MTTTELRKNAKARLDSLPPDKVKVAAEFIKYLEISASNDATMELLKIPGIIGDIKEAAKQIKKGMGKNWRKVQKMYKVHLLPKAEKFFARADINLARKLASCFKLLESAPTRHPNIKKIGWPS